MRNSYNPAKQPETNLKKKKTLVKYHSYAETAEKHLDTTVVTEADVLMYQKRKRGRKSAAKEKWWWGRLNSPNFFCLNNPSFFPLHFFLWAFFISIHQTPSLLLRYLAPHPLLPHARCISPPPELILVLSLPFPRAQTYGMLLSAIVIH